MLVLMRSAPNGGMLSRGQGLRSHHLRAKNAMFYVGVVKPTKNRTL